MIWDKWQSTQLLWDFSEILVYTKVKPPLFSLFQLVQVPDTTGAPKELVQ